MIGMNNLSDLPIGSNGERKTKGLREPFDWPLTDRELEMLWMQAQRGENLPDVEGFSPWTAESRRELQQMIAERKLKFPGSNVPVIIRPGDLCTRRERDAGEKHPLRNLIQPNYLTMLAAFPRLGKTTWLARLFQAIQDSNTTHFCDIEVCTTKILVITEEPRDIWDKRSMALGYDSRMIGFIIDPFGIGVKPNLRQWKNFIDGLTCNSSSLIVFDSLANLWPVIDEDSAGQITAVMTPLRKLASDGRSVLLVFHTKKTDGDDGTAVRGSSAIVGAVDILLEMRRMKPGDETDCRRVITSRSRNPNTPKEIVVELTPDGFRACGSRDEARASQSVEILSKILPPGLPGIDTEAIRKKWPTGPRTKRAVVVAAIREASAAGKVVRSGAGKRNDPFLYSMV
jgi:AAA domain